MQVWFGTRANLVQTPNWTRSSVQVQQLHGTELQVWFAVLATVEFIAELHLNAVQTTGTVRCFSFQKPHRSSLKQIWTKKSLTGQVRWTCKQIWNKKSVAGQVCWTCKQIWTKKSLAGQVCWTSKQIWESQLWFDPLCDCDMTCTHTQSHGYGFSPGQNICTHTCTLGKTCPLPTGLPLPVQYTICSFIRHRIHYWLTCFSIVDWLVNYILVIMFFLNCTHLGLAEIWALCIIQVVTYLTTWITGRFFRLIARVRPTNTRPIAGQIAGVIRRWLIKWFLIRQPTIMVGHLSFWCSRFRAAGRSWHAPSALHWPTWCQTQAAWLSHAYGVTWISHSSLTTIIISSEDLGALLDMLGHV